MKNRIGDLRNHLFETIEALKDPDNPMDIERAGAIKDVGQAIINSAKVEVDFLRATGEVQPTGFLESGQSDLRAIEGQGGGGERG
jgi:hypothetical protein